MPTVRQRGDKYQAIVRIKRNGSIVHQESKTFATERLAEDWGKRVEARVKSVGVSHRKAEGMTLATLLRNYLESLSSHKDIRRSRASEIEQLASDKTLGTVRLTDLTPSIFSTFASRRRSEGAGPSTVKHNLATAAGPCCVDIPT